MPPGVPIDVAGQKHELPGMSRQGAPTHLRIERPRPPSDGLRLKLAGLWLVASRQLDDAH